MSVTERSNERPAFGSTRAAKESVMPVREILGVCPVHSDKMFLARCDKLKFRVGQ